MNTPDQRHRDPLFDALRAEMDTLNTPPGVEKELLQAFARQFPRKRPWHRRIAPRGWVLGGGGLAAAALSLALLVPGLQAPRTDPSAGSRPVVARSDDGGLFIALDSAERIEREAAPRMVETELPRSSLAALGLPLTPENAGDAVRAELLVAADGQALAVRLSSVADARRIAN
jgi:hypothetical protein